MYLRIGNGVGKQGYGNRPPVDDRNPIRKCSIDPPCLQNQWGNSASTDSPRQRIEEKADTEIHYRPLSGPQKGQRKGATSKKSEKSPKSVKIFSTLFDTFRHFAHGKKTSKSPKSVNNTFDTFRQFSRGTSLPPSFGGL